VLHNVTRLRALSTNPKFSVGESFVSRSSRARKDRAPVACPLWRESAATTYLELLHIGEEKVNRDNPKIKIHRNPQQTHNIPKVNRDKNSTSASPNLRLPFRESYLKSLAGAIFRQSPITTHQSPS